MTFTCADLSLLDTVDTIVRYIPEGPSPSSFKLEVGLNTVLHRGGDLQQNCQQCLNIIHLME